MADTSHSRRDDYIAFSENDPFAELTRIMGHDPRVSEPAREEAAAPVVAPVIPPAVAPVAAPMAAEASPSADDFAFDLEKELAGDFSDFDEPAPAADWRDEAHAVAGPTDFHADPRAEAPAVALDADFEDFFASEREEEAAPAEQLYHAPVEDVSAPLERYEAPAAFDDNLDDALERELLASEPEFTAFEVEAAAMPAPEPVAEPAPEFAPEPVEEDWTVDAAFDLDMLERELAASPTPAPQAVMPPVDAAEVESDFAFDHGRQAEAEPPASHSLSLEDELNMLLADDPAPVAPVVAAASTTSTYPAPSPSGSYGRANFASAYSPAASAYGREAAVAAERPVAVHPAAPVFAPPAFEQPVSEPPASEPFVADDALDDIFGDDFDFQLDDEPVAAAPAGNSRTALPEIETVEIAEAVQPVADDLDIPDIAYEQDDTASAPVFDDFEADFADVFGELGRDEAVAPMESTPAAAALPDFQPYMLDDAQWQSAQAFPEADADYESDLERAIADSSYDEDAARPASRRRGILVAAAVAGVALLGGLGVFGMSMFGGGSDTPAFVRADPDPIKVRPENPGGTTVPNQDSEVYQRVSGGASDTAPAQERLISSTESPVDVTAREPEIPEVVPGVDEEDLAGLVKSEDRIEPETPSASMAEETAVVTPRRVRTMIVRPDGTMVPREEIEPAVVAEPLAAAAPIETAAPAEAAEAIEADDGPVVETPQTVAVVPTRRVEPQAAAPAATRPAAPAPAPQAAAPRPAAAPVSAPVAAAPAGAVSEWSMQIASQPTAESAQSAYQDLARRYGGVLEGRGVAIVRADIEGRGTYYRVRIPASSRDEAIQLCTRYKAAGGSCFVSR